MENEERKKMENGFAMMRSFGKLLVHVFRSSSVSKLPMLTETHSPPYGSSSLQIKNRFTKNLKNICLSKHSAHRILCTKCNFMPSIEDGDFPAARLGYWCQSRCHFYLNKPQQIITQSYGLISVKIDWRHGFNSRLSIEKIADSISA